MNELRMADDVEQGSASLETIQKEVEKLRQDVKNLESQFAALSLFELITTPIALRDIEIPYPTEEKRMRCKTCKNIRFPHKSNPHYKCIMQNKEIDPKLTCGLHTQNERCRISSVGDTQ